MAGEIIRKGDPTSHGGHVLEGSIADICMSKPIAYLGHMVYCPQCKGSFPIVEGAITTTFYGRGVALAGMKTACGAVLMATQFTDTVEWSSGASGATGAGAAATAAMAAAAALVAADASKESEVFDEQYALVDEDNLALCDMPYTAKLPSGELFPGITDDEGRTNRFVTNGAQQIEIEIGHHPS